MKTQRTSLVVCLLVTQLLSGLPVDTQPIVPKPDELGAGGGIQPSEIVLMKGGETVTKPHFLQTSLRVAS